MKSDRDSPSSLSCGVAAAAHRPGQARREAAGEARGRRVEEGAAEGRAIGHDAHVRRSAARPSTYTATAGTLVVRNEKDEPWASMGYIGVRPQGRGAARAQRPIAFCYNGGPGSSSIWLHMGALGPRRVVVADAAPTPPPPYQVVDNAYSLLDKADLVLIDPVGTGFSKPVGESKDKDFWGVDPDIESVSRFIKQYVTDNGRWNSPKYLIGESYGTTRSAGVVELAAEQGRHELQRRRADLASRSTSARSSRCRATTSRIRSSCRATRRRRGTTRSCRIRPTDLEPWLDEVRRFARGRLRRGAREGRRGSRTTAAPRSSGSSTSTRDCRRSTCAWPTCGSPRASSRRSSLRQKGDHDRPPRLALRRTDRRHRSPRRPSTIRSPTRSPGAYTAAFLDWYHEELKFGEGKTYVVTADALRTWDFRHKVPGLPFPVAGADQHRTRSRSRHGVQPEPASPRTERPLRPRDALLRDAST